METITFNCRFITPAFLGGADPQGTPELRPPSIKGALRFWWRAQCGITDLDEMKRKEFKIFGGVDGEVAKKSSVSIRVSYLDFITSRTLPISKSDVRNKFFKINIFEYLAFGTYDRINKENVLNRDFVEQGQEFRLTFRFTSPEYKNEVLSAFRMLIIFGGIGTKSRNGFGKFEVIKDKNPIDWMSVLKKLKSGSENSYTSFSNKLCCFQTSKTFTKVEQAWAETGKAYKNAREFIENPHDYYHRSFIASPIVDNKRQKSFLDRHAKSYFFSVVPEGGKYRGLILFLPYLYLTNATGMMQELYSQKEKNPSGTGIQLNRLKKILIQTPISKHQEFYKESNGIFHEVLCRNENPHSLNQIVL